MYESRELQVEHEGNVMGIKERGQKGKEKIEKNEVMEANNFTNRFGDLQMDEKPIKNNYYFAIYQKSFNACSACAN